jgi:hypothetical protein
LFIGAVRFLAGSSCRKLICVALRLAKKFVLNSSLGGHRASFVPSFCAELRLLIQHHQMRLGKHSGVTSRIAELKVLL